MATAILPRTKTTSRKPTKSELATQRYAQAAKAAGVPRDQIENFLRAGIVLQPRQLAASAPARECDQADGPLEIGFGGARGGGKSHWMLAQLGADDCQRQPGLKCLLLRKVGKANKENFEDLRRKLLMGIPHRYARQEGILTFENGSFIVLGHFQNEKDIDNYLGLEYDAIGVEEATTLTFAKYRDITTCNRTSKPGWRPRTYNSTNPGGVGHGWYKARFVAPYLAELRGGPKQTRTRFVPSTARDNRFLNRDYVSSVLESLTGWKRRAWLDGDWDIAAGQFFTTWRADVHVIKPFPIPRGWRVWGALDYGFTHFTVFYLLAEDGDGNIYLVDEHAEQGWLPQRHAPAIKSLLERHGYQPRHLWKMVAGADLFAQRGMKDGEAQTLAESYQELGLKFEEANTDRINGAGEILVRLGDLEADPPIRPTLFIFDRCARLIECIPALEHDPHRPEDVLKVDTDEDGNGGDDPYDAARYGIMAAWRKRTQMRAAAGPPRPQAAGYRPR